MRTLALLSVSILMVVSPSAQRAAVTEYVAVVGADGAPVDGLTRDAFRVTVDDAAVVVEEVTAAPPMAIALVLDATSSMRFGRNHELSEAALSTSFVDRLRPGDRARLFAVAPAPVVGGEMTTDPARLRSAIHDALDSTRTGPSPIWDAVRQAAQALSSEPGPRVILLSSDGRGSGNVYGFDAALQEALMAGVTVSVIGAANTTAVEQMQGQLAIVQPDLALRRLASQTGGAFHLDSNAAANRQRVPEKSARPAVEVVIDRIMTELQHRYALRFSAPADGKLHRLRITVNSPSDTVHARTMFVAR